MKILLAVLFGFVLGILLWHPRPAKAGAMGVTLTEIKTGYHPYVPGDEIVGFACTANTCYIATR